MALFQYSSVGDVEEGIRLIHLLPGQFADPICCTIEALSLDSSPPFEALSYFWGDPTPCESITINGGGFNIAKNLHVALPYLRHEKQPRLLWIDAICINQADVSEENQQVQKMDKIYQRADRVVVWLGDANEWLREDEEATSKPNPYIEQFIELVLKWLSAVEVHPIQEVVKEINPSESPIWLTRGKNGDILNKLVYSAPW